MLSDISDLNRKPLSSRAMSTNQTVIESEHSQSSAQKRLQLNSPDEAASSKKQRTFSEDEEQSQQSDDESESESMEYTFMGLFETWGFSKYVIDGRFLFSFDDHKNLRILDLFHSKEREFTIDLTSARIKKRPLKKDERYSVVKVFPLNLSSVVVVFNAYVRSTCYLGYGRIDIERSSVSIGPTIEIYDYFEEVCGLHLFPFSYPLDLKVGIIIQFNLDESDSHLHVRMGVGGSLYAQKLEVPVETKSFGYFDDSICGFIENWSKSKLKSVDLSKYSLETEQQTRHRTTNWQILNEDYLKEHTHEDVCCVGETLYTYCEYKKSYGIVSLDLNTLKWTERSIVFDNVIQSLHSDGNRTLIVCTDANSHRSRLSNFYRFVYEPDKLSDCVWLRLKQIFDSRPGTYDFIISQLPANFKPKCPFS